MQPLVNTFVPTETWVLAIILSTTDYRYVILQRSFVFIPRLPQKLKRLCLDSAQNTNTTVLLPDTHGERLQWEKTYNNQINFSVNTDWLWQGPLGWNSWEFSLLEAWTLHSVSHLGNIDNCIVWLFPIPADFYLFLLFNKKCLLKIYHWIVNLIISVSFWFIYSVVFH